jgi:uncharacterized protein YkwD
VHGRNDPDDHGTGHRRRPAAGRHRKSRRLPGPLGLATAAAVLLLSAGVGAALLPASLTSGPGPAPADTTAAQSGSGAGEHLAADLAQSAPPPSPVPARPPAASPVRTVPPSPTPTRKTSPTAQRTVARTATSAASAAATLQEQVVALVNQRRAANGCGTVKVNSRLTQAAQLHSEDQAAHNTMSHTGSDGSSPWDRAERAGYDNAIGENVAMGYATPAAVMDGWMNSDGHRANILHCTAKAIGMGFAKSRDGTPYWTQMFGSVV